MSLDQRQCALERTKPQGRLCFWAKYEPSAALLPHHAPPRLQLRQSSASHEIVHVTKTVKSCGKLRQKKKSEGFAAPLWEAPYTSESDRALDRRIISSCTRAAALICCLC